MEPGMAPMRNEVSWSLRRVLTKALLRSRKRVVSYSRALEVATRRAHVQVSPVGETAATANEPRQKPGDEDNASSKRRRGRPRRCAQRGIVYKRGRLPEAKSLELNGDSEEIS